MRLIVRNDASLAVGLIVAAIVVFQQPLRFVLDATRDVEARYHLDLVPALTIVAGVFIFHQYRKRQLSKVEAFIASADAARSRARSAELERLMIFSQALANALDFPTMQQVLSRNLPTFAQERAFWVLAHVHGRWQEILQDTTHTAKKPMETIEPLADRAVAKDTLTRASLEGIADGQTLCFPMVAGGVPIGVLGVPDGVALGPADRTTIGAAAGLIAIALRNVQLFKDTRDQGLRDGLTGCFNREHCLETLNAELRRAKRSGRPLSILMFDIDHFKTINDELGHLRGDETLRAVGAQLARLVRSSDVSCRYGGDEFLIILPDTQLAGAEHVAETLRREIATLSIPSPDGRVIAVTVSIGLAAATPGELDVSALVRRTDEALYQAKRAGRNRACLAIAPSSAVEASSADRMPAPGTPSLPRAGVETILVADDEPFVRQLIRKGLEPHGFTVLLAGNAAEAIAIATKHRGSIHLLLTDVVMPDLHGPQLAQRVRELRPEIGLLYMSGFIGYLSGDEASAGSDAGFLAKPFTPVTLLAKVREQLIHTRDLHAPVPGMTVTHAAAHPGHRHPSLAI